MRRGGRWPGKSAGQGNSQTANAAHLGGSTVRFTGTVHATESPASLSARISTGSTSSSPAGSGKPSRPKGKTIDARLEKNRRRRYYLKHRPQILKRQREQSRRRYHEKREEIRARRKEDDARIEALGPIDTFRPGAHKGVSDTVMAEFDRVFFGGGVLGPDRGASIRLLKLLRGEMTSDSEEKGIRSQGGA